MKFKKHKLKRAGCVKATYHKRLSQGLITNNIIGARLQSGDQNKFTDVASSFHDLMGMSNLF